MSEVDPIYKELAAKIGYRDSKYIPQILAKLANLEQAKILNELPVSSAEEIAERLNLDKKTVDKHIRELYEKGLLYYSRSTGNIRFCQDVMELRDAVCANPKFDEELGDKFFDLWDAWSDSDEIFWVLDFWRERVPRPPEGVAAVRLLPHWKSIKDIPGVLPCEDVREIFRANEDTLAINPCSCLRITKKPERGIPEDICFVFRKTGEYCVDRGSGRKITVKEAMDILKEIEKYAMVHTLLNEKRVRRLVGNSDKRCHVFKLAQPSIGKHIAPTRFQATVEPEKCLGCKTCVDQICLFGAAQMKYYPEYGEERAYIDTEKCMGCGNCVIHCPIGARTMKLVRPPEFIPDRLV